MPSNPNSIIQEQAAHIERLQTEVDQLKLDKSSLARQLREAKTSKKSFSASIKLEEDVPLSRSSASSSSTSGSKKRARPSDSIVQAAEASESTNLSPGDRLLQLHRELKNLEIEYDRLEDKVRVLRNRSRPALSFVLQQEDCYKDMHHLRKKIHSIIFPNAKRDDFHNDGLGHVCGIDHKPRNQRWDPAYARTVPWDWNTRSTR